MLIKEKGPLGKGVPLTLQRGAFSAEGPPKMHPPGVRSSPIMHPFRILSNVDLRPCSSVPLFPPRRSGWRLAGENGGWGFELGGGGLGWGHAVRA